MSFGPDVATIWEVLNAVMIGRDLCIRDRRKIIHGSVANKEIDAWFTKNEFISWTSGIEDRIYG